jgi:CheY-like chemotaxis protein
MRILLAEDEEMTAAVLGRPLTSWGHDVTVAADGPAAWRLIQQKHFPVVLSDWMMPGLDGLERRERP